jgi:hypothetical protein
MKQVKILSALGLLALASTANAEISGSAAIASSYHWRGFDLGSGTPAVSAELRYTAGGFYAAGWVSSGDTTAGTEYDLYAGYGGAVGDFNYDISYISYIYPTGQFRTTEGPGDFAEVIGKVGYGPVKVFLNYNVAGATKSDYRQGVSRYAFPQGEYMYYGITGTFGPITALLAHHDESYYTGPNNAVRTTGVTKVNPGVTGNATHLDLTYAYNANLSFTVSAILDSKFGKTSNTVEPKPKLVATYTVPFGK